MPLTQMSYAVMRAARTGDSPTPVVRPFILPGTNRLFRDVCLHVNWRPAADAAAPPAPPHCELLAGPTMVITQKAVMPAPCRPAGDGAFVRAPGLTEEQRRHAALNCTERVRKSRPPTRSHIFPSRCLARPLLPEEGFHFIHTALRA